MPRFTKFVFLALLACVVLLPQVAKADGIGLGIGPPPPPPLSAAEGETVTFFGSLQNNSNFTLTSGNLSFEFTESGDELQTLLYDGALFFSEALPENFSLAPGASTQTLIPLFTVTIGRAAIPGTTYIFDVQLFGPGNTSSNIVTTSITATAAVPEPATLLLLGTGLAGVAAARRRAKQRER